MPAVCVAPRILVRPNVSGSREITSGPYAAVVGPLEGVAVGVAPPPEGELLAVGDAEAPPELAVGVGVTPPGVGLAVATL
jgi:hypothetical protein